MQKLDEKKILGTVPKKLQLVETFWDCPEFSKGKNKGITLIALIITIIVMLILVGVTINVALNGGLFEKANEAKRLTQLAADKEELQIEIATAYNEKEREVNFSTLATNLSEKGWTVTDSGDKLVCTSLNGNTFTVDKKGKITEGGNKPGGGNEPVAFDWGSVGLKVDTNAEYSISTGGTATFSTDGKVKILNQIGQILLEIDATIEENIIDGKIDCEVTVNGFDTNAKIRMNEEDESDENIYCEVGGMGTIILAKIEDENVYTNEEVLEMLGITNYTGTYNGTWTKIGTDENGNAKLVSTENVATYTLGSTDPRATDPTVEGSLEEGASEFDIAIWSYKNAVNSLNEVVEKATKGIPGARSINVMDIETLAGIQDSDKGVEYNKPYIYNYTNYKDQIFVTENGETVKIDSAEKQVTLKHTFYNKKLSVDDIGTLASGDYLLASPCVSCNPVYADFYMRYMYDGNITYENVFSSNGIVYYHSRGVRAVVSVSGL